MLLSVTAMERPRWTDERLDKAFGRIDADIRELRVEVRGGFERADKRFEALDTKFDTKFDSLQRTLIIGFVTLFASIVASVIGGTIAALALH
jgi:hypothetical protein